MPLDGFRGLWTMANGFGADRDVADDRDHSWTAPAPTLQQAQATPLVDVPQEPPVWSQRPLWTCTSNAVAAALQMARRRQGLEDFQPSRLFIHYYAAGGGERARARADVFGVSVRSAVKAVNSHGAPPEPLWPYRLLRRWKRPSEAAQAAARADHVISYARLRENDVDQIKASLVDGRPVIFSFLVSPEYEALIHGAASPLVQKPSAIPPELKRHSNLIVGYDQQRQGFRVRNSWGARFGDAGHCLLAYDYVADRHLANDFWRIEQVQAPDSHQGDVR